MNRRVLWGARRGDIQVGGPLDRELTKLADGLWRFKRAMWRVLRDAAAADAEGGRV